MSGAGPLSGGVGGLAALAIVFAASPISPAAAQAKSWRCVAEQATGFICRGGKWAQAAFDVADNRYLIAADMKTGRYMLVEAGERRDAPCDAHVPVEREWISCRGAGFWRIHVKTGRYVRTGGMEDASATDACGYSPFVEIGRCTAF